MAETSPITVVVPAYQAESFLEATLRGVERQTLMPREVVVVDDGSTDGTATVVERLIESGTSIRLRLIRERHRGPGATRNSGIRAAATEWIAFLDADDLWAPEKLSRVARAIRDQPEANFFCHNEIIRGIDGTEEVSNYGRGFNPRASVPEQLFKENRFSTSAVVCRTELLRARGGFDERLSSAQDYELWLRLSPDLVPVFIPDVLGTYVMRRGNISTSRYWRRLWNLLRVRHRYRDAVSPGRYVQVQSKVLGTYLTPTWLRRILKVLLGWVRVR